MQFLLSDLFKDFPTLRFVIPHGGGAVPYHWGRYRGLAQDLKRPPMTELLKNVWFDTCVYHRPGVELLLKVIPAENILFASEIVGAVKGIDPETGLPLRRHQALHRRDRVGGGRRPREDLQRQRAQGLSAARGASEEARRPVACLALPAGIHCKAVRIGPAAST